MRGKYRSAVYVEDERAVEIRAILTGLQADFDAPLVTQILPLRAFKPSEARFRDYYATDPTRPFCRAHVDPKLARLRAAFAPFVKP